LFPPGAWEKPEGTKLSKVTGSKQSGVSGSIGRITAESWS